MVKKVVVLIATWLLLKVQSDGQVPLAHDLAESGERQKRDLSLPGSRVVINPFDFRQNSQVYPAAYSNRPELPLNIGFLSTKRVSREVKDLLSVYQINHNDPSFSSWTGAMQDITRWISPGQGNGAHLAVENNQLVFQVNTGFHYFTSGEKVRANLDVTPTLKISIPNASIQWSVKVNDGGEDVALQFDTSATGVFYFNIPAVTGWSGNKEFQIKVYAINYAGTSPASISVDHLALTNDLSLATSWKGSISDPAIWQTIGGGVLLAGSQGLKFEAGHTTSGFKTKNRIKVDLNKTPLVLVSVPDAIGAWSLKINDGTGDKVLRGDSKGLGLFEFNIRTATGWSGYKEFDLVFYSIGISSLPSHLVIGDVRISGYSGVARVRPATSFTTRWRPYDLPFSASYHPDVRVEGYDFFFDKKTVVRHMQFEGDARLLIAGYYSGSVKGANDSTIMISRDGFAYAVSSNVFRQSGIRYYKTLLDLKAGMNALTIAPASGYWSIEVNTSSLNQGEIQVAVAIDQTEAAGSLPALVYQALTGGHASSAHLQREREINSFLEKVPHPLRFDISKVPSMDVTAEAVKKEYYKAWVYLASNLLDPEAGIYPYPQIVTGKASLWDEGDSRAPFSATWESLLGLQLYGFIDPAVAWQGFKGLMSLTDADGLIGGESLPSRKAQTAWVLYQQTGDRNALLEVYPPLERYMNWRLKYPHWIYYSQPTTELKDAEFVFHGLIDLTYMAKIANEVKTPAIASAWEKKAIAFANQALTWFWPSATAVPYQTYNTASGSRSWGNTPWVTIGLYSDLFKGDYLAGLKKRFTDDFGEQNNFYLPAIPKYPDLSYTVYGLLKQKMTEAAETLIDAGIRDLIRSGMFAEYYEEKGVPFPKGVRPSLFGANTIIDMVWLKNGFEYDKGEPHVVNIFQGERGVRNINYGGKLLSFANQEGRFSFAGTLLEQPFSKQIDYGAVVAVTRGKLPADSPPGKSFNLYPNPSQKELLVSINLNTEQPFAIFSLYNSAGSLVYTKHLSSLPKGTQILTFRIPSSLPGGCYFYRFRTLSEQYAGSLIRKTVN